MVRLNPLLSRRRKDILDSNREGAVERANRYGT